MTETPMKQCKNKEQCVHPEQINGGWLPKTPDYFGVQRTAKSRNPVFSSECKYCKRQYNKDYHTRNKQRENERCRHYYADNREERREYHRYYRREHRDSYLQAKARYRAKHRNTINDYSRRWRKDNVAYVKSANSEYHEQHRTELLSYARRYRNQNHEAVLERTRRWRMNGGFRFQRVYDVRRQARKHSLPASWNNADWQRALDYFNGCCAVCGRQLNDLFGSHTAAADHWIPLKSPDCPGTIPTNMIPLCHGTGGCNNRKGARDPIEFLETEFGKRRAAEILARIHAYFEWVRQQRD